MKRIVILMCLTLLTSCTTKPIENQQLSAIEVNEDFEVMRKEVKPEILESINSFVDKIDLLSKSENSVYSPISLYATLTMLIPALEGESKEQLLNFLELENGSGLGDLINKLNYTEFGITRLINSLWLNIKTKNYNQNIVDELKSNYLASSHLVDFSEPTQAGKDISEYINKQTDDFLNVEYIPDPDTDVLLLNTLLFSNYWYSEFQEDEQMIDFKDVGEVKSVKSITDHASYYENDLVQMTRKNYMDGSSMLFIRPKNGLDSLPSYQDMMKWVKEFNYDINYELTFRMPEVEVSSNHDQIKSLLVENGLEKVLTDNLEVSELSFYDDGKTKNIVSKIVQQAKIKVDREGTIAGAFTVVEAPGAQPPSIPEKVEITLDVPYMMVLLGVENVPLFIVNIIDPTK